MNGDIVQILQYKTIAVVGLSTNPEKISYTVAKYMQDQGYRIVPVRPGAREILGERVYESLTDIPFPVDIVDVFRKPEFCEAIAEEAARIDAKALWLQLGITNENAARIAHKHRMLYVQDRCILQEHKHLRG